MTVLFIYSSQLERTGTIYKYDLKSRWKKVTWKSYFSPESVTIRLTHNRIPCLCSYINPLSLGARSRPLKIHIRRRNLLTVIGLKCSESCVHCCSQVWKVWPIISSWHNWGSGSRSWDYWMFPHIISPNLNLFAEWWSSIFIQRVLWIGLACWMLRPLDLFCHTLFNSVQLLFIISLEDIKVLHVADFGSSYPTGV